MILFVVCVLGLVQLSLGTQFEIVESVPLKLPITNPGRSTYDCWIQLINNATQSIDASAMYLSLSQGTLFPPDAGGYMGLNVINALVNASRRGVTVRFVINYPPDNETQTDVNILESAGVHIKWIYWNNLTKSVDGILHTKFLIVDNTSFYLGSANWDWRSLAQVKELGVCVTNNSLLTSDIQKIFSIYWLVSGFYNLPPNYPIQLDTQYNLTHPTVLETKNSNLTHLFLAASPPPFNTPHRTNDIDALVWVLDNANSSVYASVMDYAPYTFYEAPGKDFYWGVLDDAFRRAAYRGVSVKLLFSIWDYTRHKTIQYMRSLNELDNITVRLLKIPPFPGVNIPYARVAHSKYVVTDNYTYITTSNWTPDYFLSTGGVSITFHDDYYRSIVQNIFTIDWTSPFSIPIENYKMKF